MRRAFLDRPRLVEGATGFCGLEVLTEAADPAAFLLVTRWVDENAFHQWHRGEAHHQSHQFIPKGLKLDASFTSVTVGRNIRDADAVEAIGDAIEGQTVPLSKWLMNSDTVFGLVLGPDGTIRSRNPASYFVFPEDPSVGRGAMIWDYLIDSDAETLRELIVDPACQNHSPMLMNLANGDRNPITVEVAVLHCGGPVLLIGTQEHRHDLQFEAEILRVTNDLSMLMREAARRNRELLDANETIARLARMDALTGLANRRTLQEGMLREIARASRLREPLSLVIADLDRFKSINDAYGHLMGDQILARVAAVLVAQSRPYDLAARFGGEELALLLPASTAATAVAVAERIRAQMALICLPDPVARVTASFGVATWKPGESPEDFLERADGALYRAKNLGRDRVEVAENEAEVAEVKN